MALKTSIQNVCKRLGYSVQELPNIIKVLQEGFADVATEAGDVDTAVSDVGTLKTRMTTAEGKIETLEDYTEYSTTEHIVGKWIDGSDVYEKVVDTGSIPDTTSKTVPHNISDIDKIINYVIIAKSNETTISLPYVTSSGSPAITSYLSNTAITITSLGNLSNYSESHAIIRYTKNTEPSRLPDDNDEDVKPDEPIEK